MHSEFLALLQTLEIDAPLCESYVGTLRSEWERQTGDSSVIVGTLNRELKECRQFLTDLRIKFVKNDADVQSYDAEMSADYKSRIARLESEVSEAELAHTTFDELLEFSRSGLKNVALARSEADMNLKQKSSRHPVSGGFRV